MPKIMMRKYDVYTTFLLLVSLYLVNGCAIHVLHPEPIDRQGRKDMRYTIKNEVTREFFVISSSINLKARIQDGTEVSMSKMMPFDSNEWSSVRVPAPCTDAISFSVEASWKTMPFGLRQTKTFPSEGHFVIAISQFNRDPTHPSLWNAVLIETGDLPGPWTGSNSIFLVTHERIGIERAFLEPYCNSSECYEWRNSLELLEPVPTLMRCGEETSFTVRSTIPEAKAVLTLFTDNGDYPVLRFVVWVTRCLDCG